jgi:DNA-binding CsgD family transcriptional regulator
MMTINGLAGARAFSPIPSPGSQRERNNPPAHVRPPDLLTASQWEAIAAELNLSGRESEIVRRACYDENIAAIAEHLQISPHTVRTHRERLYRKLRARSLCQVVSIVFAVHILLLQSEKSNETLQMSHSGPTAI